MNTWREYAQLWLTDKFAKAGGRPSIDGQAAGNRDRDQVGHIAGRWVGQALQEGDQRADLFVAHMRAISEVFGSSPSIASSFNLTTSYESNTIVFFASTFARRIEHY